MNTYCFRKKCWKCLSVIIALFWYEIGYFEKCDQLELFTFQLLADANALPCPLLLMISGAIHFIFQFCIQMNAVKSAKSSVKNILVRCSVQLRSCVDPLSLLCHLLPLTFGTFLQCVRRNKESLKFKINCSMYRPVQQIFLWLLGWRLLVIHIVLYWIALYCLDTIGLKLS